MDSHLRVVIVVVVVEGVGVVGTPYIYNKLVGTLKREEREGGRGKGIVW